MIKKNKPYRNKKLMDYAHKQLKNAMCCACKDKPWVELHHYGSDGGTGLKPSDHCVARVCLDCHKRYPYKYLGLLKNGLEVVLIAFMNDSLEILKSYIESLEK